MKPHQSQGLTFSPKTYLLTNYIGITIIYYKFILVYFPYGNQQKLFHSIMRRSFSHASTVKKSNSKYNKLGNGFQMKWKFRNSSQQQAFFSSFSSKNQDKIKTSSFSAQQKQKKHSQQIKDFIKNMKITDEDQRHKNIPQQKKMQTTITRKNTSQSEIQQKFSTFQAQKSEVESVQSIQSKRFGLQEQRTGNMNMLEVCEKKLETLIELKLKKKPTDNKLFAKRFEDELQKQLNQLIKQVRSLQLSSSADCSQQLDNEIKEINRKIVFFQKIIAQSFTNSEMMKKYYHNKRAIKRSPYFKSKNQFHLTTEKPQNLTYTSSLGSSSSIYYQTTNQFTYTKPAKQHYKKEIKMSNSYVHNNQPIPRSVYNRKFLNYGALPTYKYTQPDNFLKSSAISQQRQSVYQTDFDFKKSVLTNANDLDCKRDKIKTSNISFMQRTQKTPLLSSKQKQIWFGRKVKRQQSKDQNMQKTKCEKQNRPLIKNQSENQGSFCFKSNMVQSCIKDKNLNNLKYQYKKMALA